MPLSSWITYPSFQNAVSFFYFYKIHTNTKNQSNLKLKQNQIKINNKFIQSCRLKDPSTLVSIHFNVVKERKLGLFRKHFQNFNSWPKSMLRHRFKDINMNQKNYWTISINFDKAQGRFCKIAKFRKRCIQGMERTIPFLPNFHHTYQIPNSILTCMYTFNDDFKNKVYIQYYQVAI